MQSKTLHTVLKISQMFAGICAYSITGRVIDPKAFHSQRSADQR